MKHSTPPLRGTVVVHVPLPGPLWWALAGEAERVGCSVAELIARRELQRLHEKANPEPRSARTDTRARVAALTNQGLTPKAIAAELHCTVGNVQWHQRRIREERTDA